MKPGFKGRGIGKAAVQYLEKLATSIGIRNIIAVITYDNKNSIKLFERAGYEKCAHFKQVGEKFGEILDVVAYQKML